MSPIRLRAGFIRAAALALSVSLATNAIAEQQEDTAFDVYGKFYPEWRVDRYGAPSNAGTRVGNLGTLRNDTAVLSRTPSLKPETSDHDWSNSYIGIRGRFRQGDVVFGYDLQGLVDLQGSVSENFRARDAFVYGSHPALGTVYAGQMDSFYKEYGDIVRMLGVSSGNFVSTSRILSGVAWRGQGETTFHNRRGNMLAWESPEWSGVQAAVSHSFDSGGRVPGNDDTLTALALRWRRGDWYLGLATEVHRNWLPMSFASPGVVPAMTSILNDPGTARSRDQAWRLTAGWAPKPWRFGFDLAQLRYSETDSNDLAGKFREYRTVTWQASAEYWVGKQWGLSVNHARGAEGRCRLSGEVACSAEGMGGHLTSVGALRAVNRELSVFLLGQHVHNAPGGRFASAAQGGTVRTVAVGVKYEFK